MGIPTPRGRGTTLSWSRLARDVREPHLVFCGHCADKVLLQNQALGTKHVFVNEGDTYEYSNGSEFSYVSVIDTASQTASQLATIVGLCLTDHMEMRL